MCGITQTYHLTLWDKLQTTNPDASEEELLAMNKMSAALVLTSQGWCIYSLGRFLLALLLDSDDPGVLRLIH